MIMYYIQDYLDLNDRFKAIKVGITRGMARDTLINICNENNLNELETNILLYFYCERRTLLYIANKIHYSYDYTAELKSNIIKRINKKSD